MLNRTLYVCIELLDVIMQYVLVPFISHSGAKLVLDGGGKVDGIMVLKLC